MSLVTLANTKHFPLLALSAAGVKKHHWYAVLFKIANDDFCRPYLRSKLKTHSLYLRSKYKINVSRKLLFDIVELALKELRNPLQAEDKDVLRARMLNLGEATFDRKYKKLYDELYAELNDWASRGESKISGQFNPEDLVDELLNQSYDAEHGYVASTEENHKTPQQIVDKEYNG